MIRNVIILILIFGVPAIASEPCEGESNLVILAPQSGATTYAPVVSVRGFTCVLAQVVIVENETTGFRTVAETQSSCEDEGCVSTFATLVYDLQPGPNRLSVGFPGEEERVTVEVLRAALAAR